MTRAKKEKEKQPEPVRLIYNGWVIEGRREGTRTFWRTMVIYEPRPYAHANSLEGRYSGSTASRVKSIGPTWCLISMPTRNCVRGKRRCDATGKRKQRRNNLKRRARSHDQETSQEGGEGKVHSLCTAQGCGGLVFRPQPRHTAIPNRGERFSRMVDKRQIASGQMQLRICAGIDALSRQGHRTSNQGTDQACRS